MTETTGVAVVVVSFETRDTLLECLDALARESAAETVLVDNASRDGSAEAVRGRFPQVRLVANPANVGFGAACNQGARESRSPLLLFLNPDATLAPGGLAALATLLAARPQVGVVGPRTRSADGAIQVSTGPDLTLLSELRQRRLVRGVARRDPSQLAAAEALHAYEREVDWVSGACLMVRREVLGDVGAFDEGYFLFVEDMDWCRRIRDAGWTVVYLPDAVVTHHIGVSRGAVPAWVVRARHRGMLRHVRKHFGAPWPVRAAIAVALTARASALIAGNAARRVGRETPR